MNILITSLGRNWEIIPELLGFFNPEDIDIYRNHNQIKDIMDKKEKNNIEKLDEVWIITTKDNNEDIPNKILEWREKNKVKVNFRIWITEDIEDLNNNEKCKKFRDTVLRIVLLGKSKANGKLYLSLVGGRKTMSADIQHAGYIFGCERLVHIVDKFSELSREEKAWISKNKMDIFSKPLQGKYSSIFTPILLEKYAKNTIVARKKDINIDEYNVQIPKKNEYIYVKTGEKLNDKISYFLDEAYNLRTNYEEILKSNEPTNFRILYTLPNEQINKMKNIMIGKNKNNTEKEMKILKKLPKAELHCHLGGVLDTEEIIEVAKSNIEEINYALENNIELKKWVEKLNKKIEENSYEKVNNYLEEYFGTKDYYKKLRNFIPNIAEPILVSTFLLQFKNKSKLLEKLIFGNYVDEGEYKNIGINKYEKLGDLQGSALLQNENSIRKTVEILLKKMIEDNVKYLEIRCSPVNYTRAGLTMYEVVRFIQEEIKKYENKITVKLLIIASRHGDFSKIDQHVELSKELMNLKNNFLVGFDLAGDESSANPSSLREKFLKVMEDCLHITIHAGETVDVKSIWEAVYYLNAERIGHGLTLINDPRLMEKIYNQKIALEMCPSSNYQIVGYSDYMLDIFLEKEYPLKDYLKHGIKVTINTDNPGISRTNLSKEYYKAASMTKDGISIWDLFQIIKNGYNAGFVERTKKRELLLDAESTIYSLIDQIFFVKKNKKKSK